MTLDHLVKVRILVPQYFNSFTLTQFGLTRYGGGREQCEDVSILSTADKIMKMRIAVYTILFIILFLIIGCMEPNRHQAANTCLTQEEVIQIAKDRAKSEGYDLGKYNMMGCHYEFTQKDHTWTVFFELKPPTPPGGQFTVSVDDQTKRGNTDAWGIKYSAKAGHRR